MIEVGPQTRAVLEQHRRRSRFSEGSDLVFSHPGRGTALDPGTFARAYLKPALARAGIEHDFRPFHDLRHTSLTHAAAAGNPNLYVQARAGHTSVSVTERYLHASKLAFPGAAERSEQHMFGPRRHLLRELLKRSRQLCTPS